GGSETVSLNLPDTPHTTRCEIDLPPGPSLEVQIENGNVQLMGLEQNQKVTLDNGNLVFAPKDINAYEISARVEQGMIQLPDQKPAARRLKADLKVTNGTITGP